MARARCGFARLRECSLDTIQTDFRRVHPAGGQDLVDRQD